MADAERLRIAVLGPLEGRRGGLSVDMGPLKVRSVLGLLAMQPNSRVSREEIIDVLWGDRPPDTSANLVHTYIARLRKVLEADPTVRISSTHGGYRLIVDDDQLDLLRFAKLVKRAREVQDHDPVSALSLFEQALNHWRAPVLADLPASLRQHPVAVAVSARRLAAALGYADLALALDRAHEQVVDQLRPLARAEPLHEGLHARLMLAVAGSGQQAAALRLFTEIRGRLADELGMEPGPEIKSAHLRIVRQDLPAVTGRAYRHQVPAQLPADITGFAGRGDDLDQLDALLRKVSPNGRTAVVIAAITGTAGVGKTALAVHWAHRVRDRFPDGQLYVNLRGFAPGPPVRPMAALTRFLHALGVRAQDVPVDEEEAANLYRTLLANRTALILLDNAASAEQVRPLLPGNPGCVVLITSRDRLTGLTAAEGAHRRTLEVLAPEDAYRLVSNVIGEDRALAEPAGVAALTEACAYLPLALRIASANLTSVPHTSISEYMRELCEHGRLTALTIDGGERGAVLMAFDLSYTALKPEARRLFRLLGLVPGPDFTSDAAAALTGSAIIDSRELLYALAAAHLVDQHVAGRYQFHDLLREYARMLARDEDKKDIGAAIERLLDFYLHTADAASRLLYPHALRLPIQAHAVAFDTKTAAIEWLESERANLVAAAITAPDHGMHSFAWQIADCLRGYFLSRGHSGEGLAICNSALSAARYTGSTLAQASVHDVMGLIHYNLSDFRQAIESHTHALEIHRETDNRAAVVSSLHNLGRAHSNLGESAIAVRCHEQALEISRDIADRRGEALALNYIGAASRRVGRLAKALADITKALHLCRQLDDRDAEARALHSLGVTYWTLGRLDQSVESYQACLALARSGGNLSGEAITLVHLAQTNRDAGRYTEAGGQAHLGITQSHRTGDRRAEARGLEVIASIHQRLGDYRAADSYYAAALQLVRRSGYFYDEASILVGLSSLNRNNGRLVEAKAHCQDALAIARDTEALVLEGSTLTELAHVHLEMGDIQQAEGHSMHALEVVREREQRLIEGRALHVLGLVRQSAGDDVAARSHWRAALEIFSDIRAPEARQVGELLGVSN